MNKKYKYTAIIGLRNNNSKYTTHFYSKIISSRNLIVCKNWLIENYPDYIIEIIENHIDTNISDDDLENKVKEYEKSNFIFREKSRQSKFEQSKSEIKQFEQSDLQEFSKYVNKLKLNITIDIQSNKYLKKKYNPYTKSWFVEKEISFDELVTMILHKEESMKSKNIDNKENTITENPELIQQLQDKDKEIENLKKQNQELIKKIELMNNIELENEIIQLKKEIKELKSQLNSAKEQLISSAAKSDNSIDPIKSNTTKIEVKCHDDDLFNSMFAEEEEEEKVEDNKSQSQSHTLTDNGISTPKAANVINTNVNNNTTQKIPNIQRFRGSVTPYKQDITDDELYALAAAL